MRLRRSLLLGACVVIGLVCVRLGFWQLSRLEERREYNALLAARRFDAPVPLSRLPADTAQARFRRVRLHGRYDYGREIVWAFRTRNGSPGVNIITPFRTGASDTAVLVNRGWVYSPDASSVDLGRWREGDTATIDGYVQTFQARAAGERLQARRTLRSLDHAGVSALAGGPIRPFYIVLTTSPGADSARIPPRVGAISLDEGSHKSYAMQWFAFATIAFVGGAVFARRRGGQPGAPGVSSTQSSTRLS